MNKTIISPDVKITYQQKCADRIEKCISNKLKEKQNAIDIKNSEINEKNRTTKERWKLAGKSIELLSLTKKEKKYTQSNLVNDINEKRNLHLTQQMLHLYAKGKVYPPVPVLKDLADYFNVSFQYLAGVCDVPNIENATIQKMIHLDYNAIQTLQYLNDFPEAQSVMNALLSDKYYIKNLLIHIKTLVYQKKLADTELNQTLDDDLYQDSLNQSYIKKFAHLASLFDYWEKNILEIFSSEFDADISAYLNQKQWQHDQHEEYERTKVPSDVLEPVTIDASSITNVTIETKH